MTEHIGQLGLMAFAGGPVTRWAQRITIVGASISLDFWIVAGIGPSMSRSLSATKYDRMWRSRRLGFLCLLVGPMVQWCGDVCQMYGVVRCGMVCTFFFFDVCAPASTAELARVIWLYGCSNELQVLFSGYDPCSAANPLLPATAGRLPATLLGRLGSDLL